MEGHSRIPAESLRLSFAFFAFDSLIWPRGVGPVLTPNDAVVSSSEQTAWSTVLFITKGYASPSAFSN